MEQFSHDLTLALEETSRSGGVRTGRWGVRRRTRSTGNLPCAPQPTEDSSSSPADGANNYNGDGINSILSDSDDRQELKLSLKSRQSCPFGNFESDSLNENFSPARPNTRRKRKFKRMTVEYETTPSTPGNVNPTPIFPIAGTSVKKRVLKHTSSENFRANLFFCGKRKRSHRDRYFEQHSSSVPRQRDLFAPKNSYSEYRSRNRSFSSALPKPCERILPLNNSIVSKIEKISQDSRNKIGGFQFVCMWDQQKLKQQQQQQQPLDNENKESYQISPKLYKTQQPAPQRKLIQHPNPSSHSASQSTTTVTPSTSHKIAQKSDSFDSALRTVGHSISNPGGVPVPMVVPLHCTDYPIIARFDEKTKDHQTRKNKHSKRLQMQQKMQLQFDDPNVMDCGGLNEFLSSSSLSSSDSEAAETNDSDREGDDELTDWPGNEAMVNFTSKNDFKRAKPRSGGAKPSLPQIKSDELGQDDDTLMSADEMFAAPPTVQFGEGTSSQLGQTSGAAVLPPTTLNLSMKYSPLPSKITTILPITSMPIDIHTSLRPLRTQIESEMSGETSNHFLSSPNMHEVREIRAGCRRVRNERPGFTILTSVNEDLSKFLQDARQEQLTVPYTDEQEHEKLMNLAKLYSLSMHVENGCAILTKTSNTTQAVKIDRSSMSKRLLSDYKRRCYGGEDDPESSGMAS